MFGKKQGRYAALGWAVSKFVLPVVKKQVHKKARSKATGSTRAVGQAARNNSGKLSIAVGSAIGAVGYALRRKRRKNDPPDRDK